MMARALRSRRIAWAAAAVIAALLLTGAVVVRQPGRVTVEQASGALPADGVSTARVTFRGGHRWRSLQVRFAVAGGDRSGTIESVTVQGSAATATFRSSVLPGTVQVTVEGPDGPQRVQIETRLDESDSARDGTPDFLRLAGADERAFREWFAFLAEEQFYRSAERRTAEVNDCAALVRYAYREALRGHDGAWATELGLEHLPPAGVVSKYRYPFTPLGASLYRVRAGNFRAADLANGAFAEFADAETLLRLNTHFVSRDLRAAQPGDLLFFRQARQREPFHTMVYVGRSHFDSGGAPRLVYHTGPEGADRGEVRRPTLAQLMAHPQTRWHPVTENPNFLGVYRWNILRAEAR